MKLHQLLVIFCLLILPALPQAAQTLTPMPDQPLAPDFELTDVNGKKHRLADYRGRVVIVNFWATWCTPCRKEMPSMQRAWERLQGDGVVMLGINVGEDEEKLLAFTADYPVDFPLLLDRDSTVISQWPVKALPTTFIVDAEGRIAYRAIGSREWDDPALLVPVRSLQRGVLHP